MTAGSLPILWLWCYTFRHERDELRLWTLGVPVRLQNLWTYG